MKILALALFASASVATAAYAEAPRSNYTPPFTSVEGCTDYVTQAYGLTPQKSKTLVAEDAFLINGRSYELGKYGGHVRGVCTQALTDLVLDLSRLYNATTDEVGFVGGQLTDANSALSALRSEPVYQYRYWGWGGAGLLVLLILFKLLRLFFRESRGIEPEKRFRSSGISHRARNPTGNPMFVDPNPAEGVKA